MRWIPWPLVALLLVGCVSRPAPEPATLVTGPPPWAAPRDAVSYIRAAGLPELPLDSETDPFILTIEVFVDGEPVPLAPFIGIDRLRALQAPVHTHEASGDVWLEGEGNRDVTLGQFFTLWGVRFDDQCLGSACEGLDVLADGAAVTDPASLILRDHNLVEVRAQS
ncbi:hypothetical protein [Tessaracoccus antarcticus]|uniref:Uncharacterized protein n=1 Tax=Tessaracoccus antarcticus TaxID=2479848 RepID=A0A3M0G246_9ACTN|nr:hypothetical protein [Tessaracoccus antarcticus]RMB58855.1 hypothetical protein EAX62_12080 [Tessaracoccus antarcticus]